ncbi:MAG: hypothetical protein AAGG53_04720 [Cyanobacteria bacterium P01_H01_bin.152]
MDDESEMRAIFFWYSTAEVAFPFQFLASLCRRAPTPGKGVQVDAARY